MAETEQPKDQTDTVSIAMNIVGQYTKDLSFEAPETPGIFSELQKGQPDISINVGVSANHGPDDMHEVILHVDAKCTLGDKSVFVIELEYAGLINLTAPETHVQQILMVEVPRYLFPFARGILAETTRDAGFMPMMLGPIDFQTLYQDSKNGEEKAN